MERVEWPNQGAGRRTAPSRPGLERWLAPLEERSQYPGITGGADRGLGEEFAPRLLVVLAMLMYAWYDGPQQVRRLSAAGL